MSNLEYLNANGNEITTLTPLKTLRKLKHLDVGANRILSLNGVKNLFALEYFNFERNRIAAPAELAVLLNFPQLTHLGVVGNSVVDKMDGKLALARAMNVHLRCILNDEDDKLFKEITSLIGRAKQIPAK